MTSDQTSDFPSEPNYAVALPCQPEDFSRFISSLLGKPQTISKSYSGSFEIKHEDIESAFHLVNQRVSQQNKSNIINFTVRLVFDDNSTVLLNSLEDFKTYTEVRPLIVTQAHLSWSFLVKFEDRRHPEKQEIDLSFITKSAGGIAIFDTEDSPVIPISKLFGGGHISFRIKHTARTWGADIEALLSGHVKHIMQPEKPVRYFIRKNSGKIAMFFGFLFFICSIAASFYSAHSAEQTRIKALQPILSDMTNQNIKLNALLDMVASGYWGSFFFSVFVFTIFSLIIAVLLGLWVESSADAHKPSYILLTRKSEQFKILADEKYRKKFISFLTSIATGIVTGVISNIIFTAYWTNTQ